MAGSSRSAAVLAVGCLWAGTSLAGQTPAGGRVVRVVSGDTLPLPGMVVVLHRVNARTQGPIDTVRADRQGRFGFRFVPDSGATYLLSARHHGIEYFSAPIALNPAQPDTAIIVLVADTSSNATVTTRQRTVLISRSDESGTRAVLDWFVVHNGGSFTRVAPDTLHPSWGASLPPEAENVDLADGRLSQFAPEALAFRNDSVRILAPISPGDKELLLQYRIPGSLRRFIIPTGVVGDSVFILLEDGKGSVESRSFGALESQSIEGRVFQRWSGIARTSGNIVVLLAAPLLSSNQMLALFAGFAALAFVLLGFRLVRVRPAPGPISNVPSALELADTIARLDARYTDRESETPPGEWSQYLEDRVRLRAELQRALDAGRRS